MASDETEEIVGEIPVRAKLAMGSENLTLVFTNRRMLIAHRGKAATGGAATTFLLGSLSTAIEDIIRSGKNRKNYKNSTPEEILAMDKDNFAVDYGEIANMSIERSPQRGMVIVTSREKLDLSRRGPIPEALFDYLARVLSGRIITTPPRPTQNPP